MDRKDNKQLERYRVFVREYINNGFNGSEAYAKAYNKTKSHSTESMASALLSRIEVFKLYQEELARVGFDISDDWIMREIIGLFKNSKKEATKSRMLELLSKIKALYKESTQSVAIFSGLEGREQSIINDRLRENDIQATLTQDDSTQSKT